MYRFLVILLFAVIYSQSQIVAFPGAEGFGAYSKGGLEGLFVEPHDDIDLHDGLDLKGYIDRIK